MSKHLRAVIIVFLFILMGVAVRPSVALSQTKEELEDELKKIEAQIVEYEKELAITKTEKQTLSRKISALKKDQEKIALQIKATNLQISELNKELSVTESSIEEAQRSLNISKQRTASVLRELYEHKERSLIEVFLAGDFSSFLRKVVIIEKLSEELAERVKEIKTAKAELEEHHNGLEIKQGGKKDLLAIQTLQRQNLQQKTGEQASLLKTTQGKEVRYQAVLADSKKRAQEIRNRIYELLGVSSAITFGEAVEIARWVQGQTGVRAELVLAVLTQESNLGKNVGTCNRRGDPASKSWRMVMKPARDQEPFLAITKELGLDPDTTPVSCPMRDANGSQMGWGGAMGPAQFIPSTWMLYKNLISAITGKPANPWDIRDAFLAAALLLKDNGAASGKPEAEWRAAMLYFSGSTNPQFRFYGDNVVAIATRYEDDIAALNKETA